MDTLQAAYVVCVAVHLGCWLWSRSPVEKIQKISE